MRLLAALVVITAVFCSQFALAERPFSRSAQAEQEESGTGYVAQIELHTAEELHHVLKRADKLFSNGGFAAGGFPPVAVILHGAEAKALQQSEYPQNKALVDLAARLSAFQVVDIKVCEVWMQGQRIDPQTLPPFIGTVENGPREIERLQRKQGYVYF